MVDWDKEAYRARVAHVFQSGEDASELNGTLEHAIIVIEEAMRAAKASIKLLSTRLDPACYENDAIRTAVRAFLCRPGTQLEILVEQTSPGCPSCDEGTFLATAFAVGGDRVRVAAVPANYVEDYSFNFLTVDGESYRFENDRRFPLAIVQGGPSAWGTAQHLSKLFDRLFAVSTPIALAPAA